MTFWKWSATGNWITFTNELMLKVNNWFGPLWFLTFTRVISLSCLQASSPTISTYVCFCHFKAHKETQRMLVGFINDHHFPALFPEGRQPVCHCGLCVTSCLLFFFSLSGGRVKTWKRRWFILTDNCLYYFEYTTVSLTPTCFFFFLLTKGISAAVCVCLCHRRAEHFIFILRSLYEIHPESTASLLIITSSLFHSTRKTTRINNSSLLHCCYGYGFQQGALHVNSTNQT